MNYIARPFTYFTIVPRRPRVGIVLHNTEGTSPITTAQVNQASWHWLLDRDGTIYQDVLETHAAWHVAATGHTATSLANTRWRPDWLPLAPPKYGVSDANYATIGVELVGAQIHRDAGEPYTAAQYASLRELLAAIEMRYGRALPIVGHGQLQMDRSDPVQLDWAHAGLVWNSAAQGYLRRIVPPLPPDPIPPVEEPAMLTDDQARDVAALLWAQRQQVFMPGFAIPDAWLRELRAGRYRGLPQGAELDGPDGTKVQAFDAGVAVWVPASGVTWQA